ncbi:hypothetical protein ES703_44126 [subsurface metagenome]
MEGFTSIDDRFMNHIGEIDETREFLEFLYKDPKIATPFNKPVISVLITACDYLSTNLEILRAKTIKV